MNKITYYDGCWHCIHIVKAVGTGYKESISGEIINQRIKRQDQIIRDVLHELGHRWTSDVHEEIINRINSEGVALSANGQVSAVTTNPFSRFKRFGFGIISD